MLNEDITSPNFSRSQYMTTSIAGYDNKLVSVSMIAYTLAVTGNATLYFVAVSGMGGFPHCLTYETNYYNSVGAGVC